MAYSLNDMPLQGIMVVVFIILDWMSVVMTTNLVTIELAIGSAMLYTT